MKYMVDTCVFNWLVDGHIKRGTLTTDGDFVVTHIQADEISNTPNEERKASILRMLSSFHCEVLPTETFLFDVSRLDYARLSDGRLFTLLKTKIDGLSRVKSNNARDALIAESAILNQYTLITADKALKLSAEKHGCTVIFFEKTGASVQRS